MSAQIFTSEHGVRVGITVDHPEDEAAYREAVSQWCGRGVQVFASG